MKATILYYNDLATGGSSDKEYRVQIEHFKKGQWNPAPQLEGYVVLFQYGRRGGTLTAGHKCDPVQLAEAERIYDKLVREKTSKGYVGAEAGTAAPLAPVEPPDNSTRTQFPVELLEEVTREEAELLVKDDRYLLQTKLDGHRRQIEKTKTGDFVGYNKKGEPVALSAELVKSLKAITLDSFFLDGEIIGDKYYAFDIFFADGTNIRTMPYEKRWLLLDEKAPDFAVDTWHSTAQKQAALALLLKRRAEGICFKRKDAPYRAGRNGQHKKFKFLKSASCKVIGMGHKGHNSATLALLDKGKWREVGRVSLNGKDSRIKLGSILEITFLYVGSGGRLYQPRVKEMRTDIAESECVFAQLKKAFKEGIAA